MYLAKRAKVSKPGITAYPEPHARTHARTHKYFGCVIKKYLIVGGGNECDCCRVVMAASPMQEHPGPCD